MKKSVFRVRYRPLTLLFVLAFAALLGTLALEVALPRHGPGLRTLSAVLFTGALLPLALIAWRITRFHNRVQRVLRRLVTGDYETGLRVTRFRGDEFSATEHLLNRLTEQLREYDALRTTRIRQLRMTLDLVLEHAEEPMGLFDVEKGTLTVNAAMSGAEDAARHSVPLKALRDIEPNASFVAMLARAAEDEKSPQAGRVTLHFPKQESPVELDVRVVPFKDKDDRVPLVVVFGKSGRATSVRE